MRSDADRPSPLARDDQHQVLVIVTGKRPAGHRSDSCFREGSRRYARAFAKGVRMRARAIGKNVSRLARAFGKTVVLSLVLSGRSSAQQELNAADSVGSWFREGRPQRACANLVSVGAITWVSGGRGCDTDLRS
jgi:hypothetical protein